MGQFDRLCTYACRMYRNAALTFADGANAGTPGKSPTKSQARKTWTQVAKQRPYNGARPAQSAQPQRTPPSGGKTFDVNKWAGTMVDSVDTFERFKRDKLCIYCGKKGHKGFECALNPKGKGQGPSRD